MKKTIFMSVIMSAVAGAALFAGGSNDPAAPGRGYGMGFINEDGVDLINIKGTVEKDSYGNLVVKSGKTAYIVSPMATLDVDIEEGTALEGEGFEGNTVYTKSGVSYKLFHLTMATVNGETSTVDLSRMGAPLYGGRGGWYGSEVCTDCDGEYYGRGYAGGMMGGGMMGGNWDRNGRADGDDWGYMGRGYAPPVDSEDVKTLTGTIKYLDGFHPVLATGDGNYLIRMGRMQEGELAEGSRAEATGYVGPSLYTNDGEDYYSLMLTSLKVDGEEVALDYYGGPFGGRSATGAPFMGGMGRRR